MTEDSNLKEYKNIKKDLIVSFRAGHFKKKIDETNPRPCKKIIILEEKKS